jgi:hypothetical protein
MQKNRVRKPLADGGIGQGWACPSGINPAKPAQAAEIKVPRIVQHTPRGRAWKVPEPDPEAEARAAAFFERMGIKRREGG